MLKLTKIFSEEATLDLNSPEIYAVDFRSNPNTENSGVFTLPELLELTDFLQQIRPLIVDELEQYHKK